MICICTSIIAIQWKNNILLIYISWKYLFWKHRDTWKTLQQTIRNNLHRFWRIYCKTVNIILGCCKNRVVVYALWEESIFPSTHLHKSFSSFIGQPLMDIRETVTDTNNFLSCITTPPLLYFICSLILFRFFSYLKQKRCEISSM